MSRTPKVLAASFLLAAVASVGCAPSATAMSGGSPVPQSEADATLAAAFASVLLAPGVVPGATDALTRHQCGGALIAPDRIVTAAHCVVDPASLTLTAPATPLPPEQLTAAIGATGRTTAETPLLCAQDRTITDATPLDQARSVQAGYGDSGGPLVMFLNGTPTVLGVFSFGTETVGPLFTPGFNAFTPV